MLLEFIVLSVIGIVFLIIGWLIWKWCGHNWNRNHSYRNYRFYYANWMGLDCIWGLFCEWIWTYGLCRDEI